MENVNLNNSLSEEHNIKIKSFEKAAELHRVASGNSIDSNDEIKKKRIQINHQRAAKHYLDAANFYNSGEPERAYVSKIKARWYASLASELSCEINHSQQLISNIRNL